MKKLIIIDYKTYFYLIYHYDLSKKRNNGKIKRAA